MYICIHNWILFSLKKEWNLAICDNMDGPRGCYEKSQMRKKNTVWFHFNVESKINKLINKTETDYRCIEKTGGCQRAADGGGRVK